MKRKDLVSALLRAETPDEAVSISEPKPVRVAAGSVRAMGLELSRLTEEAGQAEMLRAQLTNGSIVVDLDPELIEPSFIADRLVPTGDQQYRQLVESIRKEGQTIPILVRPLPNRSGVYQIAYGHRRWHAARELGNKVRAIVQPLNDAELVVAQGKENAERRNLSFIERALFAANLTECGVSIVRRSTRPWPSIALKQPVFWRSPRPSPPQLSRRLDRRRKLAGRAGWNWRNTSNSPPGSSSPLNW